MSVTGWVSLPDTFPWPPKNGQVVSSFDVGSFDVRWDDPATLADGKATLLVQAQGTILVRGTPKTQIDATGFYRFVAPVPVNSVVIIANKRFVAVNGPRQPGWNNFQVDLPTLQDVAADFADAVNDINNTMDGLVIATADGTQVNLTPMWDGADGNTISLETSTDSIVRSGSTLLNGQDADFLTFGGVLTLTAVAGPRTPGGLDFSVDGNNFDIANSIRDAINDPANLIVSIVTATAQYGQVVLTATPKGELGNAVSLFTSDRLVMQLSNGYLEGGVGDENCQGITNAGWNIVGVNVYRSDNGERGPYIRLNQYPVSSFFYRDNTDNVYIENETVPWSSWISKGDSPNNRAWTMRTFLRPIVKRTESHIDGLANNLVVIPANSPDDVKVVINGQTAAIDSVFGPTGEITLINRPYFDPVTEKLIPPVLPSEDASVSVSYYYNRNRVDATLDRTNQIFYRLTTVALDPSSPTGYKETPLGYSPPLSPAHVETIDYIWKQGVRRNRWILEQGGERVKLFKRKVSGVPCPCRLDEKTLEWNKQPDQRCHTCFPPGTMIRTEHGFRPIESIRVGDLVLTASGEYRPVLRTMRNPFKGELASIKFATASTPLLCTPDHPILRLQTTHDTKRYCGPKCDMYIHQGDGVGHQTGSVRQVPSGRWWARVGWDGRRHPLGTYATPEEAQQAIDAFLSERERPSHSLGWSDASDIAVKDWVVPQWDTRVVDMDQIQIPSEFTKKTRLGMKRFGIETFNVDADFLWMCGLYLAEGSTGSRMIVFSLHANETFYQEELVRIFRGYGFNPTVRIDGNKACVYVSSTSLALWFKAMFGGQCYSKRMPDFMLLLPPEKQRAIIQGIWDGDGSKSDNEICQTSEMLNMQMVEILHRIGEQPLARPMQSNFLTPNGNKRRLAHIVNWAEPTFEHTNRKGRWMFKGHMLAQVQKVESVPYDGDVYNLEVDGDHTYVAHGIAVHNCFGTSWVGGFDGPIDIIIAPDDAERNVMQTNYGRKLEHQYEVWTGPSPSITQRDFIVKQTNERYSIGPVRRPAVRGLPLQQHFNIGYLDTVDIRYRVPINGTSALPWPETRYTDPSTPCNDVAPYTVGFDYQATPMETEDPGIPDSRELRGRTPVWENIMNRGGKGR